MKKGIYYGVLLLGVLSLASCGHQKSDAEKAASAKAESSRVAAAKASASSKAASLKLKHTIAASAKKEAASASRESIAAASSAKMASASEQQAAMAKAQSESAAKASSAADTHAALPESVATGIQVNSLAQAAALVKAKLGTGDPDNPITWTTMTATSDSFEDSNGQTYYWIRGEHQSMIDAQKNSPNGAAGSADGLDYYVYQNGLIRSRDVMAEMMTADD